MEENVFEVLQAKKQKQELSIILSCNDTTERFGLSLSGEEARELVACRDGSLKKYQRVEFGKGMLEQLIFTFCDSPYINQNSYMNELIRLQEIFYLFKNESDDKLSDDELMVFMREQFDTVCAGDMEYLESTCLPRFALAIRSGYEGYKASGGHNEYGQFDEEQRWDRDLYQDVLKEIFW